MDDPKKRHLKESYAPDMQTHTHTHKALLRVAGAAGARARVASLASVELVDAGHDPAREPEAPPVDPVVPLLHIEPLRLGPVGAARARAGIQQFPKIADSLGRQLTAQTVLPKACAPCARPARTRPPARACRAPSPWRPVRMRPPPPSRHPPAVAAMAVQTASRRVRRR